MRVRKVLADEHVSNEQIARIVGSDAGLAARVLTLANSAALNRSGRSVADLKTAINRIGHNNVRTAAVSFAIAQLRRASELRNIAQELERCGRTRRWSPRCPIRLPRAASVNADESMLAGLLHNVGKLYILARANRHGSLFSDPPALAQVMRDWHANVGKAIVENWGFPEHIAEAIGEHENIDRTVGQADVTRRADGGRDGGRLHGPRGGLRAEHAGREGVPPPGPGQRQVRAHHAQLQRRDRRAAHRAGRLKEEAVSGWRLAVSDRGRSYRLSLPPTANR